MNVHEGVRSFLNYPYLQFLYLLNLNYLLYNTNETAKLKQRYVYLGQMW